MAETLAEARQQLAQALRKRGVHGTEATTDKYRVDAWKGAVSFKLSFLPGNRRTLVSHDVVVTQEYRGQGLGTEACLLRESAAREAGVTLMLATVMDDNVAEVTVLEKCEWRRLTQNKTTKCSLWGKQL